MPDRRCGLTHLGDDLLNLRFSLVVNLLYLVGDLLYCRGHLVHNLLAHRHHGGTHRVPRCGHRRRRRVIRRGHRRFRRMPRRRQGLAQVDTPVPTRIRTSERVVPEVGERVGARRIPRRVHRNRVPTGELAQPRRVPAGAHRHPAVRRVRPPRLVAQIANHADTGQQIAQRVERLRAGESRRAWSRQLTDHIVVLVGQRQSGHTTRGHTGQRTRRVVAVVRHAIRGQRLILAGVGELERTGTGGRKDPPQPVVRVGMVPLGNLIPVRVKGRGHLVAAGRCRRHRAARGVGVRRPATRDHLIPSVIGVCGVADPGPVARVVVLVLHRVGASGPRCEPVGQVIAVRIGRRPRVPAGRLRRHVRVVVIPVRDLRDLRPTIGLHRVRGEPVQIVVPELAGIPGLPIRDPQQLRQRVVRIRQRNTG